jgi:hypothetical protein
MTKYAQGTPESVMQEMDAKIYGNKNKRNETAPPLKITAEMREKADASEREKNAMAQAAFNASRASATTIQKPNIQAEQVAAQRAQREEQKAKADAAMAASQASTRGRGSFGSTPPRTTTPAVQPKPQPKIIVDPVRPMPVTGVKPMTGGMSQPPRPMPPPRPFGMKKGGAINLAGCKVSTAKKNTKSRF